MGELCRNLMNKKNILFFALGPVGAGLSGFMAMPVMTWYFSVEDIGRYSLMQVLVSLSVLVASLGLDQAYVREYHNTQDKHVLFFLVLVPGSIIMFFLFIFGLYFSKVLSDLIFSFTEFSGLFVLVLMAVLLSFYTKFLGLLLRMEERGGAYSIGLVVPKIFFLILLLLFMFYEAAPSFYTLLQGYVFSLILYVLILAYSSRENIVKVARVKKDFTKLNQYLRYSLPLLFSGLAFWLLTAVDRFFLRAMSSLDELGLYSVAINFAGVAVVLQGVFSTIWVPIVFKWISSGQDFEKIKIVTNWVLISIYLLWSAIGVFSWVVPYFLPETYEDVAFLMMACMTYPFLFSLSEVAGIGIVVNRQTKFNLYAALFALLVNTLGNVCLIPEYGASGAASSSALSFLIYFLIKSEIGLRMWGQLNRIYLYIPSIVFSISSILFAYTKNQYMSVFFLVMFLIVLVGTLLYVFKVYQDKVIGEC